MAGLVSNRLDKIKRKAHAAEVKANKLKSETVDTFYREYTAKDIDNMLSSVNQNGHSFERAVANRIRAKIDANEKLDFNDVNDAITIFESTYSNLLVPCHQFEDQEVNNV